MNTYNSILKILRKKIIKISYLSQSAHLGSSLSCLEIIFACFQYNLKKKTEIILSKGHAALAYNVVLEYFSLIKNSERFISNNSNLWGHITRKNKNEYLKFGFGSLGYGLGISAGLAYSNRKKQVLCILSDGELNEGSFWESLLFIHHYKLKNLVILIDNNKIQSFGHCKDIINLGNLKSLFSKFNFKIYNLNGHNINDILIKIKIKSSLPKIIICNTIKGKGIPRIENTVFSHYKPALKKDFTDEK